MQFQFLFVTDIVQQTETSCKRKTFEREKELLDKLSTVHIINLLSLNKENLR